MADTWIVSCNVKAFDVVEHLSDSDTFVMKRTRPIANDDLVYLYVGKPYGRLMYLCRVLDSHVSDEELEANSYAKVDKCLARSSGYIKLKMLETLPDNGMTYADLRENGVGQLQNPSRLGAKTLRYIERKIKK